MSSDETDQSQLSRMEDVYGRLRAAILDGQYQPEQKLKIGGLCSQLGGSLGAVREALSRLLAEGLVVWEPFKGFHVAPVSPADLMSLTRARIEIDQLCLASSLANGDVEWEGRIVDLLHQLTRRLSGNGKFDVPVDEWSRLHSAFHEALLSACDNSWLLRMHRMLYEQSERYRRLALMFHLRPDEPLQLHKERTRDMLAEHKQLAEAAIARDSDRACKLIAAHLQDTMDYLLTQLEDHPAIIEQAKRAAPTAATVRQGRTGGVRKPASTALKTPSVAKRRARAGSRRG